MLPTVVLHHGIFATDELRFGPLRLSQFPGIAPALKDAGHRVVLTRVHPCASIARRAEQLKASLLKQLALEDGRVVLVAHSLGGLDARHMLAHLGVADRVAALVTVSTPHHGASLADFCHHHLHRRLNLYRALSSIGVDVGAAHDLTRSAMTGFNAVTPNHPEVAYYSITCAIPPGGGRRRPKYALTHRLVGREEGANDGIVSVRSATWGTLLGHWPIDHVAAINRHSPLMPRGQRPNVPALYVEAMAAVARGRF